MASRTLPTPQRPCWALGGPSYGPGFASTAFRLQTFREQANSCWEEFVTAVQEPLEGELGSLGPSDLRPPTVEEDLAQQLDELRKQAAAKRQQGDGGAAEQGKEEGGDQLAAGGRQKRPRDDEGGPPIAEGEAEGNVQEGKAADSPTKDGEEQQESNATHSRKEAQEEGNGQEGKKGKGKGRKERWLELPAVPEVRKVGTGQTRPAGYGKEQKKVFNKRPKMSGYDGQGASIEQQRRHQYEQSAQVLRSVRIALADPILHITPFSTKVEGAFGEKMVAPGGGTGAKLMEGESLLRIEIREFDALHLTLQEFLVPACQKMSALRDALTCTADRNMKSLQMGVPGAFFYIEGVFYVDRRSNARGNPTDYVRPIREFCQEHGIHPPPPVGKDAEGLPRPRNKDQGDTVEIDLGGTYKEMDMAQVKWEEIGLRAGPTARNIYCHQGCCEHLMVVRDVRLIHPDDPQHISAYPLVLRKEAHSIRHCDACNQALAQKLTYDDRNAPQNPAFWCLDCYKQMHYDKEDTLLYAHKVFDYNGG